MDINSCKKSLGRKGIVDEQAFSRRCVLFVFILAVACAYLDPDIYNSALLCKKAGKYFIRAVFRLHMKKSLTI